MFDTKGKHFSEQEIRAAFATPEAMADMADFVKAANGPIGIPSAQDLKLVEVVLQIEARNADLSKALTRDAMRDVLMEHLLAAPAVILTKELALRIVRGGFPAEAVRCRPLPSGGVLFAAPGLALLQFVGFVSPECDAPGAFPSAMH